MERLQELLIAFGGLFLLYYFTLYRWDYTTEAKRKAERDSLKRKGLSNTFHFTGAWKLFALIFLSAGGYIFYWLYKQWTAVRKGYINTEQKPLKYHPLIRAAGAGLSFFQFISIANRTCVYMHKPDGFAAWFSGSLWLAAAAGMVCLPEIWQKLGALAVFAAVPARIQYHLNALPGKEIPNKPKTSEIIAAVCSLAGMLLLWTVCKKILPF